MSSQVSNDSIVKSDVMKFLRVTQEVALKKDTVMLKEIIYPVWYKEHDFQKEIIENITGEASSPRSDFEYSDTAFSVLLNEYPLVLDSLPVSFINFYSKSITERTSVNDFSRVTFLMTQDQAASNFGNTLVFCTIDLVRINGKFRILYWEGMKSALKYNRPNLRPH